MIDDDVDDVRSGIEVVSPRILRDECAAHHAPGVSHQILEHRVLLRRELDRGAVSGYLARIEMELEVSDLEGRRGKHARASRQRFDSGQELLECERLGDVVVSACAKSFDLGVDGVLRGENENWTLEAAPAKVVQHLQSRFAREPHVEDDEIVIPRGGHALTLVARADEVDSPSLLLESALYELADRRVILNDQDLHLGESIEMDTAARQYSTGNR